MSNKLNKIKNIVSKYNQEHLLSFYDELSPLEKDHLLNQIENIDFENILALYENSMKDDNISLECASSVYNIWRVKVPA